MNTIELHLKRGQAIDLTDDVRVIILSVTHDKCKIGIEAPDHIRILRSELVEVQCAGGITSEREMEG